MRPTENDVVVPRLCLRLESFWKKGSVAWESDFGHSPAFETVAVVGVFLCWQTMSHHHHQLVDIKMQACVALHSRHVSDTNAIASW